MKRPISFASLPPGTGMARAPHGFGSIEATAEQSARLNQLAFDTFMEMANSGAPFADCLGSVLLTGMEFARSTLMKVDECEGAT